MYLPFPLLLVPTSPNRTLQVEIVKVDVKNELRYTYSLQRGILDSDLSYGIETAEAMGMPPEVIEEARRLRKILDDREAAKKRKKIKRAGYHMI